MRYVAMPSPRARYIPELDMETAPPDDVTVYDSDDAEYTGVLNAQGVRIYRVRDKIGFIRWGS